MMKGVVMMIRYAMIFVLFIGSVQMSMAQCGDSIKLDDWVEEGNAANGNWVVSGNGYSVLQTVNSNPAFFVSPAEYINVKLKGRFEVTGNSDDDYIGFVFGYKNPTAPVTNNLDFYLFDWKRGNQNYNGLSRAGFTLNKITNWNVNWGNMATYGNQFWGHTPIPGKFDVIATEFTPANGGNGFAWNHQTAYDFELIYTSTSIIVSIDGDTIFNENGCFEPGRFGFYNNSQEDVRYSNFTYELKADFDASEYQYCQGDTSSFAVFRSVCTNNTGSITNWNWDLGDGNTSTDSVVSHQYATTGTYNVKLTITDTANCKDSAIKTIIVDSIPSFSLGPDTSVCDGDTAFLSGKPGYTTTWSTGAVTPSLEVTTGGTYWAKVEDINSCYATDTISISTLAGPALAMNDTSYCLGDSATLTAPAGYDYRWFAFNSSIPNVLDSSQTYTLVYDHDTATGLTIIDANFCRTRDTIYSTIDSLPIPSVDSLSFCEGQVGYLVAQNGATYSWTGGSSDDSLLVRPRVDSSYYVTVTDGNGCSSVDTGFVEVTAVTNPAQMCDVSAIHDSLTSNGYIPLSGCEPVFDDCSMYYLNPTAQSSSDAQIEARALGVNLASIGSQAENDSILSWLQAYGATGAIWIGFNDIAVEGNFVWYDQSPITYTNWNAGEPNNSGNEDCVQMILGGGQAGKWNDLPCSITNSSSIIEVNLCPEITISPVDTTICKFDSLDIDIDVILGSDPYDFTWDTGDSTQSIRVAPVVQTEYKFTVTDRYSCEAYDTVTVSIDTLPIVDLGADTTICSQDFLTLSGDSGYTYLWNNGSTAQSIQASDSSIYYWLQVTDSNSCRGRDSIKLALDSLPHISISDDTICANQSATIDAGGSTHKYLWNNGVQVKQLLTSVPGRYWVTKTDSNHCKATDTMRLVVHQLPRVDLSRDSTICAGDTLVYRFPGHYTYLWDNGSTDSTYSLALSKQIKVTITDTNGCVKVDSVTQTLVTNPTPDLGADTARFCEGSAATLQTVFSYHDQIWHSIQNHLTTRDTLDTLYGNPIAADTMALYHVFVTDTNNCNGVDSIHVIQDTIPVVDLGGADTICSGDSLLLDAGPGYKIYQWSSGSRSQTDTIKASGSYNVIVIDNFDCQASDLFDLVVDTLPVPNLGNDTTICSSDSIRLYSSAKYTNVWSPNTPGAPDTVATIQSIGSYWIEITDSNGCVGRDTMVLSHDTLPNVLLRGDTTICMNDSITVISRFNPTYTYSWTGSSSSNNVATFKNTGVYKLQIQDANMCIGLDSFELFHDTLPNVQLGVDTGICQGVSLILDAGPNYNSYDWSNTFTTQQIQVSQTGTYWVQVVDQNQCKGGDTITVTVNPLPVPNLGADREYCFGTPIFENLDPGPGYAVYSWSMPGATGQQVETVTTPGNYGVTVTDVNGCKASDYVKVSASFRPSVDLPDTVYTYCENEEFRIVLDAGPSMKEYLWVDLNKPIAPAGHDTIAKSGQILLMDTASWVKVTIVDFQNCTNSDSVKIEERPAPVANLGGASRYCEGDAYFELVDADPAGAYASYRWSTNETTSGIALTTAGEYTVTITTADNCKDEFTKTVIEQPLPEVELSDDTLVCQGAVNEIDVYNEGYSYLWINKWNEDDPTIDDTLFLLSAGVPNLHDKTIPALVVDTSAYIKVVVWDNTCWVSDSTVLRLDTFPRIDFGVRRPDTVVCKGQTIVLDPNFHTTTSAEISYEWQDGTDDSIYLATYTGTYTVNVTNDCGSDLKSLYITFDDCSQVWVPNAFTPNQDAALDNETWGVSTLDEFIEFHLIVYDRWGGVVWETTDPTIQWDGTMNGVNVPGDIYSYTLTYRSKFEQVDFLGEEENAPERVKTGVVHLIR